ncbi:MAG: hypothetical protein ABR606_07715 [Vicinamibacterales bacterium]
MSVRVVVVTALIAMPVMGVDRFVPSPLAAADEAMEVLRQAREALGGEARVNDVKTLILEGPFSRAMGPRQMDGTSSLTLVLPDRLHRSEETELPGGASVERISVVAGETAWEDTQNRGGVGGGGMQVMTMFRGPNGQPMDPQAMEQARTRRMKAELQRWRLALLAQSDQPVTHAGVAEAAEGKADVLELADERGQAMRLFIDQQTHLPLMLSYQEMRPRMCAMRAGGRGAGGPGAPGGGGPPPNPEEMRRQMEAQGPPPPSAITVYLAEYRSVDGVLLPHKISQSVDGQPFEEWTLEKVKLNAAVKPELFEKKSK